jgi:hypothetical protein
MQIPYRDPASEGRSAQERRGQNDVIRACGVLLVAVHEPPAHRRGQDMNSILSRRSVLAVAAVVDISFHSRSAPVVAKALAARHKLPARHLDPLLQELVHAKILKSVRGSRSGYELARDLSGRPANLLRHTVWSSR